MGNVLKKLFGKREVKILLLGLDSAGKTTVTLKLKTGSTNAPTIPTVGFEVDTVRIKNITFTLWEVGGQSKIRPFWRHYFRGTQGLIFVIDSSDASRIHEAKTELHRVLGDRELSKVPVLVMANKQDLKNSLSPSEIKTELGLYRLVQRRWHVQPTSANLGEGLFQGLSWLAVNISK